MFWNVGGRGKACLLRYWDQLPYYWVPSVTCRKLQVSISPGPTLSRSYVIVHSPTILTQHPLLAIGQIN